VFPNVETKGEGGNSWPKHVADHRDNAVRDHHRPEAWSSGNHGCADGEYPECRDHEAPLGAGRIDRGADRCLHDKPEQTASGRNKANLGLAPVLLRHEKNVEIGTQRAAYVSEEEIQRVQG